MATLVCRAATIKKNLFATRDRLHPMREPAVGMQQTHQEERGEGGPSQRMATTWKHLPQATWRVERLASWRSGTIPPKVRQKRSICRVALQDGNPGEIQSVANHTTSGGESKCPERPSNTRLPAEEQQQQRQQQQHLDSSDKAAAATDDWPHNNNNNSNKAPHHACFIDSEQTGCRCDHSNTNNDLTTTMQHYRAAESNNSQCVQQPQQHAKVTMRGILRWTVGGGPTGCFTRNGHWTFVLQSRARCDSAPVRSQAQ